MYTYSIPIAIPLQQEQIKKKKKISTSPCSIHERGKNTSNPLLALSGFSKSE